MPDTKAVVKNLLEAQDSIRREISDTLPAEANEDLRHASRAVEDAISTIEESA